MRKKLILLTGAAAAAALLLVASFAQATIQQYFRAIVSPGKAGKPVSLQVKQQTSLSPDESGYKVAGQPPPQLEQTIRLNKGFQFNGRYFKQCKLVELQSMGPAGCPKESKVGTGQGVGSAKPVVDALVNAKLTLFNGERRGGKDHIYVFVLPDLGPTFIVDISISKVSKGPYGWELKFKIPPIKTLPSAPDAAIVQIRANTPVKSVKVKQGKKKVTKYLIVAPSTCKGKKWSFEGEIKFVDGRSVKVPGTQSCAK
jgi:hypothetical protein